MAIVCVKTKVALDPSHRAEAADQPDELGVECFVFLIRIGIGESNFFQHVCSPSTGPFGELRLLSLER